LQGEERGKKKRPKGSTQVAVVKGWGVQRKRGGGVGGKKVAKNSDKNARKTKRAHVGVVPSNRNSLIRKQGKLDRKWDKVGGKRVW